MELFDKLLKFLQPSVDALKVVGRVATEWQLRETQRRQFGERPAYFASTLNLLAGVTQVLPAGSGYFLISSTGDATALRICVGEQTVPQPWPMGIAVRTGQQHDTQTRGYILSTVSQIVTIGVLQGGASVEDARAFAQVVGATGGTQPLRGTSGGGLITHNVLAYIADGTSTTAPTALPALGNFTMAGIGPALISGSDYTIDLRVMVTSTVAGWCRVRFQMGGTLTVLGEWNVFVPLNVPQVLEFSMMQFRAASPNSLELLTTSLATLVGEVSMSASTPVRVK